MNFILQHIWLGVIGVAIAGAALIFLGGNLCVAFTSWLQFRMILHSGRTITWADAIMRCKLEPVMIIAESKNRPRRIWFMIGNDESAFFSRKGSPRSKALLLLDPPDANRIAEQVRKAGGRFVEIDMNGTFW